MHCVQYHIKVYCVLLLIALLLALDAKGINTFAVRAVVRISTRTYSRRFDLTLTNLLHRSTMSNQHIVPDAHLI